jgi:hypothetical protein
VTVSAVEANYCPSQSSLPTPDATWGVDDLGRYAQRQDRTITEGEQLLTPCYWNLGHALELARRQFNYRQWGKFLSDLKVDATRASKARAIHRTFPTAEHVSDLSVKEAYQRRERKKRRRLRAKYSEFPAVSASDPAPDLVQFFVQICRDAELRQLDAESATAEKAALYLIALDEANGELAKLRAILTRKAAPR